MVDKGCERPSQARMEALLAKIHALGCDTAVHPYLLDADAEALWFLRAGKAPDYRITSARAV